MYSSTFQNLNRKTLVIIYLSKSLEKWRHNGHLPSILQPGPVEEVKPRPWLSSYQAWENAMREVEERREKKLAADLEKADKARKQLERKESENVREAKTKLLDKAFYNH